jgi:hypothetical protein
VPQLILVKNFSLTPRCETQLSLTTVLKQSTQPRRQHLRIWREVNKFTLVLKDEKEVGNYRFYSHHEDYEDNYKSVDFWLRTWPLVARDINEELECTNEGIELETEPLLLPSWIQCEFSQLELPENFCEK